MIIKQTLTASNGRSIKAMLDGRVDVELDQTNIFSKYDFLGEKAYIDDFPSIVEIGEHWKIEEIDNNNLVFYYDDQEMYRIKQ